MMIAPLSSTPAARANYQVRVVWILLECIERNWKRNYGNGKRACRILRHLTEAVKARAKFGRAKIRVLKQNGSVESVIGI